MCGITGFIDFQHNSGIESISSMSSCLVHRGPDDGGNDILRAGSYTIGLGFRRLSIIDLSPSGHQPMHSKNEKYHIIFNGEVYNFREIRVELISLGYDFASGTDTEVILNSYIEWGSACVDKFIGMFAFAIYDEVTITLNLFRDRAGVKPLFYYWDKEIFLFSSELKSFQNHPHFRKELNQEAVALFFQHGYIPAPHSIFKNTYKLTPGSWLCFDLNKRSYETQNYWDLSNYYNEDKLDFSFEEASMELEKLLISAFKYRMIADVPVGVFLSGGYDSTAVTAILQKNMPDKLKTFTIGFHEEEFNEATYAKEIANYLGTDHTEYYCTDKEAMEIIPLLPEIFDEPFADSSAIPTYLVSKIAREKVTVALSADGGDELFAGYTKYNKFLNYYKRHQSIPAFVRKSGSKFFNLFTSFNSEISTPDISGKLVSFLNSGNIIEAYNIVTQEMTEKELKILLKGNVVIPETAFNENNLSERKNDILSSLLYTDFKTFLVDDVLQKVDRSTMAVSLEGREPLLDHRIAEFAARLPSQYKLRNGIGKVILRDVVHKYVPTELVNRPKMGFQIPIDKWFKHELKDFLLDYLNPDRLKKQGIFNVEAVSRILNLYFQDKPVVFHRLWKILVFQQWYYRWFKN